MTLVYSLSYGQNRIGKGDVMSRFMIESEKDPMKMNDQYLRDIILNL